MRRMMLLTCLVVASTVAVHAADLPLARVVLFSSGVGYFQHEGDVQGDATVPLSFRVEQINDILKSMVLQDFGGGTIGPITYAPQDPLERTLQSFAVDISNNPSLGDLLNQLRGARVEIVADRTYTGTVLGREWQEKSVGDRILEFEVINLDTAQGLIQIPVWQMKHVQLLDRELATDLERALAAIADNRDVSKRQVVLSFRGAGTREVSVGYLLETPVWKTTYRLVNDGESTALQGWAIVENTTDTDWDRVRLALVSGRPVSFTQNLYEPLYTSRPDVPVYVQTAAAPRTFEGALEKAEEEQIAADAADRRMARAAPTAEMAAAAPPGPRAPGGYLADGLASGELRALGAGVQAAATGGEVGEMFHYSIAMPVTISRQGSAMIPIVNEAIEADKVSIFNQDAHPKHPMHGFKLTNSTGLNLMGGPITVFDGGAYAGDALMESLAPDEERLVSYAMDLSVEVEKESRPTDRPDSSMKIVKGVLIITSKQNSKVAYIIKNRADEQRLVLIEHPQRQQWKLIEPEEAAETTRSMYRFEVAVAPGKTETLTVAEEMPVSEQVRLTSESVDRVAMYLRSQQISEKVKAALSKIVEMKTNISRIEQQIAQKQERLKQIGEEQERIRQNMEQLDHDSDLYRKYVTKLTEQEDEFDKVRGEVTKLQEERNTAQNALEDYIANLTVE